MFNQLFHSGFIIRYNVGYIAVLGTDCNYGQTEIFPEKIKKGIIADIAAQRSGEYDNSVKIPFLKKKMAKWISGRAIKKMKAESR